MSGIIVPSMRPALLRFPDWKRYLPTLEGAKSLTDQVKALFANGEQGAWYDPSDFSTMFQDSAGTIPVTAVEQPVGLILDKRLGLERGPELVANSTLDAGMTNWSTITNGTSATPVAGAVNVTQTATGATTFTFQEVSVVVGRWYECTFDIEALSAQCEFFLGVWDSVGKTVGKLLTAGQRATAHYRFKADSIGPEIRWGLTAYNAAGAQGRFYLVSLRELPGNHASQPSAAARPLLQRDGSGSLYLEFDGVDDKLTTTFPDLGSNATIARSVPSVGASILTGQTIGAGAWDDSTNHCGLVIVNRALTGPETASLTAYLNELAGV